MTAKKTTEKAPQTDAEIDDAGMPPEPPQAQLYAVYDLTYLRFLTPTYEDKKDADAVAKTRDDLEVREV